MDDNRRRLKRHGLVINIDVRDTVDNCTLGKLVNIHHQGLMIMSSRPLNFEQVYQLELSVADGEQLIPLSADCLWQSPASSDDCFWVGFKIVELGEASAKAVDSIIEQHTEK